MQGLKNNKGNMIIITVLSTAVISGLVLTSTSSISSILKNRVKRLETSTADQIYTRVINLLQDQRYCSEFFDSGYSTGEGKHSFSVGKFPTGFMKDRAVQLQDYLRSNYKYEVSNIQLSNLQNVSSTEPTKVFDVSVELKPTDPGALDKLLGSEQLLNGSRVESRRVFLTLGQKTGKCSLQKGLKQDILKHSQKLACEAIGGQYNNTSGHCGVKKLNVTQVTSGPYKYEIVEPDVVQSQFSFTDALCNMELNLLRKDRTAAGGYNTNNRFAWTSLCQQPKWSGCRYKNQNIPNGAKVSNVREYSSKMKKVARWAQDRVSDAVYLKANKLVGPNMKAAGELATSKINTATLPHEDKMAIHSILGGGVGLGLLTGKESLGMEAMVTSMVLGNILGPISVIGFAMKCDKGRAYVTRTCRDGQMEIDEVRLRKQKYKRFKCRWRNAGTADVPSDEVIVDKILSANGNPPAPLKIPEITMENEEKEIISDINSLGSINDVAVALKDNKHDAENPSDKIDPLEIPPGLTEEQIAKLKEEYKKRLEAVERIDQAQIKKESSLVDKYLSDVSKAIKSYQSYKLAYENAKNNYYIYKENLKNAIDADPAGDHSALKDQVNSWYNKAQNLAKKIVSTKKQLQALKNTGLNYTNAAKSYTKDENRSGWVVKVSGGVGEINKVL